MEKVFRVAVPLLILLGGLYGTERVGQVVIAPGTPTGFRADLQAVANTPTLVLSTHDVADLTVSVRLLVIADSIPPEEYRARLSTGLPLKVIASRADSVRWALDIVAAGPPAAPMSKFAWPSGQQVWLRRARAAPPTPVDWAVFPANGPEDTAVLARRRHSVSVVQIALLVVWLLAMGWREFGSAERRAPELTPEQLVGLLIDSVEGASKKETRQMRAILRKLQRGATASEALRAAKLDPAKLADKAVLNRSRASLRNRATVYGAQLNALRDSLPN